jgi:YD repeat-containing protein
MLSPRNALTVEAWINPENNMQWRKIISKSQGGNTDYSFFQGDKNNIAFSIKMGSIARTVYAPANTLPLGEWTYVVGTYDGTRMRLYINGVEENSIAISGQINYHAEPLRIGGEPGAYFKGMIDEVSIYNAALSAAEILHNYEAAQVPPSPLVQQYTYDELNRLTEVLLPSGQKIQYQYDLGGNLTSVEVVE